MNAAGNGHLDICHLLLDKGAQLEAKISHGYTPLHVAAQNGHVEIIRLLCDFGADVEARDDTGMRPLHTAALFGPLYVLKELIEERNAGINARRNDGSTALTLARALNRGSHIYAYLIRHGATI
jgi:ankyrin repeat protein